MSDPVFNMHDVVLFMTIAVCLVLALFQPILSGKNPRANGLLTVFFMCIAVGAICTLLLWNEYIELHPATKIVLPYLLTAALLIKGPALYLYVLSLTQENFSFNRQQAVHLMPSFFMLILLMSLKIDTDDLRFDVPDMSETMLLIINIIWYSIKIVPLIYGVVATFSLYAYQNRLKAHYSNFSGPALGWLSFLALGFTMAWAWTLVVNILGNLLNVSMAGKLGVADNYVSFFLVIALFAYSISFAHHLIATRDDEETTEPTEKPSEAIIEKVRYGIDVKKLHLKQNINIEEFAKKIDVPFREVSHTINKHFGTNFFEFINGHRVEEAKRLLADSSKAHMSVMDVLLESGFNSKSAFQRFFKRLTGMSPTEFRKAEISNQTAEK